MLIGLQFIVEVDYWSYRQRLNYQHSQIYNNTDKKMGICIKNSVEQNDNQPRAQIGFAENNIRIMQPTNIKQKALIQQHSPEIVLPPIDEADLVEPPPQQDLSLVIQEELQVSSDEDESTIQMEKIQVLRKVSSSGLRQSTKDETTCGICYQRYEIFNKWPMTICHNQHVICDLCVKDFQRMFHQEPFPCPFCRLLVFEFQIKPSKRVFKSINKLSHISEKEQGQMGFYLFAFEHELYEIAIAYKENRRKDIRKLEQLQFQNRQIESFPYFNYLENVVFLQLDQNKIKDCNFLLPLTKTLRIMSLSNNQIESLSWMAGFTNLEILACQNNRIEHISFSQPILLLKQLYLMGNNIKDQYIIDQFKTLEFPKLKILSISSEGYQIEHFFLNQLEQIKNFCIQGEDIGKMNEAQAQSNIFVKIFQQLEAFIIQNNSEKGVRQVKITSKPKSRQSLMNFADQAYIPVHLNDYYFYGNLFSFSPDGRNPHYRQYRFSNSKLLKLSSNFTSINSRLWIPHAGKQTLKLKLRQKNNNIMIGICSRSIKYSASVYSDQFIGITFWGNIYNKSESIPINCELRINDGSIIAMILDFDKGEISWYIDKRKIGILVGQRSFLRSKQLYFLYGVRDSEVEVEFIT